MNNYISTDIGNRYKERQGNGTNIDYALSVLFFQYSINNISKIKISEYMSDVKLLIAYDISYVC